MFTIFRTEEAGENVVVTGSKPKRYKLNNVRPEASRHFRNKKEGTSESKN